jgi:hypothetical protein
VMPALVGGVVEGARAVADVKDAAAAADEEDHHRLPPRHRRRLGSIRMRLDGGAVAHHRLVLDAGASSRPCRLAGVSTDSWVKCDGFAAGSEDDALVRVGAAFALEEDEEG